MENITAKCEFKDFLDNILRDNFVGGLCNSNIQLKLMSESDKLTFNKAWNIAVNIEYTLGVLQMS